MRFSLVDRDGTIIFQESLKVENDLKTDEYLVHIGFREEALDNFIFRTKLKVFNRIDAIELANNSDINFGSDDLDSKATIEQNIEVIASKFVFKPKEKVTIKLNLVDASKADLAVLIRPVKNNLKSIAKPDDDFEKQNLRSEKQLNFANASSHKDLQYDLIRTSPIVEGQRPSVYIPETQQLKGFFKVEANRYTMDLSSVPGGVKSFYFSEFSYKAYIPPNAEYDYEKDLFKDNLVPYFQSEPNFEWAENDSNFGDFSSNIEFNLPAFSNEVLKYAWQQMIIANSISTSNYNTPPTIELGFPEDQMNKVPLFYKKANDYEAMDNMAEYLFEIVTGIRTYESNGKRDVRVAFVGGMYQDPPLFLVNGIPTRDTEKVLSIAIENVQGAGVIKDHKASGLIKLSREVRPFGDLGGSGIVVIHLNPGVSNPFREAYNSMLKKNLYLIPDAYPTVEYKGLTSEKFIPDFRQTLYWNPALEIDSKNNNLSFFTSDIYGDYEIIVQGISSNGKIILARFPFKVKAAAEQN
jgi:hypothetical protein